MIDIQKELNKIGYTAIMASNKLQVDIFRNSDNSKVATLDQELKEGQTSEQTFELIKGKIKDKIKSKLPL